jgi:cell volume regulation protein A
VGLFVMLGLLVFPHRLAHVAWSGLGLALFLMLIARPVAVWVSTAVVSFSTRERLLLGWAGLRGAVPIVLATFVLSSHVEHKEAIFDAVFFVVIVSALLQGTTLGWVATRLRLTAPAPSAVSMQSGALAQLVLVEFDVTAQDAIDGSAVRELGLPRDALVAAVRRDGESIPPRGSTVIRAGDQLSVLVQPGRKPDLEDVFARWRRLV